MLGEKSAGMRPKTPPTGIAGHVVPTEEERANLKLRGQRTRDGLKSKKGRVGSHSASKLSRTCSAQCRPVCFGPKPHRSWRSISGLREGRINPRPALQVRPPSPGPLRKWLAPTGCSPWRNPVRESALCVHAGRTFWQPLGREGLPCLEPRPACTRGAGFLSSDPSLDGRTYPLCRKTPRVCTRGSRFPTQGPSAPYQPQAPGHYDHEGGSIG